ncbi:MAG TPA: hypothetical protein VMU39_21355 [Solirubrobacteraceae bacterium]|nr:hypothetical protein [Solirubrobacteraceae bacterium]
MMTRHLRTTVLALAVLASALALAACGSSSSSSSSSASSPSTSGGAAQSTTATSSASTTSSLPPAVDELPAAEHPRADQFPPANGRSLQQLADMVHASVQLGAATGTFTPGTRRYAFALNDSSGGFVYAPTALYIATTPHSKAQGPFLAPADPMTVSPQYRSKQNSGPGGIKAIYAAALPLPHKGTYTILALTRTSSGLIGAPGEVAVAESSPIPNVGQHPPAIATDTAASVNGNASLLTTRVPPENMAAVSFKDVLGKRPVVLLFSTPQLCISKVCGPVTDIGVELQHKYGSKLDFIHQEVYVNNQPTSGLRPQLKAFHLQTEPWLFAVNRQGVIVARLEGSFGVNAFTQAIQAALQ